MIRLRQRKCACRTPWGDPLQPTDDLMPIEPNSKPAKAAKASTKREQREASTEKILASALKLFVSKGYRSTTVDDIAGACELTKGAVYFYFPSKAAILLALIDEIERCRIQKKHRESQSGTSHGSCRLPGNLK